LNEEELMERGKVLNVAIVGGGPGCKAIMDVIFAEKLKELRMKLIGVSCTNPKAVGYRYAQEMGIYTTRDYRDLYSLEDLNMIIELTGREDAANEIARTKPDHIRFLDHIAARLFWDVFQIEEERIAVRRQAEEAVRESEEKYKTLIENSLTGIFIHQDGKYVFVNDRFAEIHGYEPAELLGKEYVTLIHPDEREASREIASKRLKGEAVLQRYEIRRLGKHGNTIWCEIMAGRIEYAGRPAVMGNIIDITERKAAEEALRKAHDELEERVKERTVELARTAEQLKLELAERKRAEEAVRLAHKNLAIYADEIQAANEELSQYAYVVSHDLKAPLRAIHNYVDFLREDLEETLVGDDKVYLNGLNRAVHQGEELVDDLLEFSRVGREIGPIESIGIGVFLEELISSLDLSPDVEVVMGNDWPIIDADATLLRQILQNLIGNAIKFNDSPHKRVELGWLPAGEERYELFVRDNGIGIEPRYHEKVFAVFQRLHTHDEYVGTGLGLGIVKKAVGKLHGSVRVESTPGKGSTFFVVLPKTQ
jgi:PAS domain S-box-containing protein